LNQFGITAILFWRRIDLKLVRSGLGAPALAMLERFDASLCETPAGIAGRFADGWWAGRLWGKKSQASFELYCSFRLVGEKPGFWGGGTFTGFSREWVVLMEHMF
jgi:hypothetical protein